jgi:hypothetical protein
MKPIRRLLAAIIFLLSAVAFTISILLLIPIQYLFTGKVDIMERIGNTLDELVNRINPDK